jgi:hypothetical protein
MLFFLLRTATFFTISTELLRSRRSPTKRLSYIYNSSTIGIGLTNPSARLHVKSTSSTTGNAFTVTNSASTKVFTVTNAGVALLPGARLTTSFTPTGSSGATGTSGDIAKDDDYIYISKPL